MAMFDEMALPFAPPRWSTWTAPPDNSASGEPKATDIDLAPESQRASGRVVSGCLLYTSPSPRDRSLS
eukprot:6934401-Pyramimonas_sp.AAC.1